MVSQLKQLCLLIVLLLAVTSTYAQRGDENARRLRRASLNVFEILPEEHRALGGTTAKGKGKGKGKGGKSEKSEKSKGKGKGKGSKAEKSKGKGKGKGKGGKSEKAVRSVDVEAVAKMVAEEIAMEMEVISAMSMSMSM